MDMKIWNNLVKIIHNINQWAFYFSLVILLLMIVFVAADVSGRYIFGKPILGDMEIQEYMMVLLVFLGLGVCTRDKQHVYVEILVQHFKGRKSAFIFGLGYLLSAIFLGLIVWQMVKNGLVELISPIGAVSTVLSIPKAPFILFAALGVTLMVLELIIDTIVNLKKAANRAEHKKEVMQNG
jgi:TRAP-type C4-dicarboxylate transport system permease small subunit